MKNIDEAQKLPKITNAACISDAAIIFPNYGSQIASITRVLDIIVVCIFAGQLLDSVFV